jgi:hypothetical protein
MAFLSGVSARRADASIGTTACFETGGSSPSELPRRWVLSLADVVIRRYLPSPSGLALSGKSLRPGSFEPHCIAFIQNAAVSNSRVLRANPASKGYSDPPERSNLDLRAS